MPVRPEQTMFLSMKGTIFAITCTTVLLLVPGCIFPVDDDVGGREELPLTLEAVHEWGIFQQEYDGNDMAVSAGPRPGNPEEPIVVEMVEKKPVIYFHGDGIGDVSVMLETGSTDIVTIPQASVEDGNITWNVKVAGDIFNESTVAYPRDEDGTYYDYLFYEGKRSRALDIEAGVQRGGSNLTFDITNVGSCTLEDIYFWYHTGNAGGNGEIIPVHFESLAPSEKRVHNTTVGDTATGNELRAALEGNILSRGLTGRETADLLEFWVDGKEDVLGLKPEETWFQGADNETANVLYFIPRSEYDSMLPLAIEPAPETSPVRVGIVTLSGIPVEHGDE